MRNEETGWEGIKRKTVSSGEYNFYSNDYSNFSYSLYSYIAADVNLSGSITTNDYLWMRRVWAPIGTLPAADFPGGTWHFVPEHYFLDPSFESKFEASPFSADYHGLGYPLYMDELVLDMDDNTSEDPNTWSFRGIKMGDVNCTMVIDGFASNGDEEGLVTVGEVDSICVQNNDIITVEVNGSASQPLLGYQMGMQFDHSKLQFLGISGGNLAGYDPDHFAVKDEEIRVLWHKTDLQTESFTGTKTFFKLHFKTLDAFCELSDAFALNKEVEPTIFYNSDIEPITGDIVLTYQIESPTGRLLSVYPNPFTTSTTFSFQLYEPNTVEIRLSDYLGNEVNLNQAYAIGTHSYSFTSLNSLTSGPLNYTVKVGDITYSGVLLKYLP